MPGDKLAAVRGRGIGVDNEGLSRCGRHSSAFTGATPLRLPFRPDNSHERGLAKLGKKSGGGSSEPASWLAEAPHAGFTGRRVHDPCHGWLRGAKKGKGRRHAVPVAGQWPVQAGCAHSQTPGLSAESAARAARQCRVGGQSGAHAASG